MSVNKRSRILVAMSGGVDSAVAAALMKRRGYDVIGVTMQIWQESQTDPRHAGCCSLGAVEDARRTARLLDIPHYVINFKNEFKSSVIDYFVDEYVAGRTPNPCVECNRRVKFDELIRKMRELDCQKLVTGHYARIRYAPQLERYKLMRARGAAKDQSYVLYMLSQEQLAASWFPLGDLPDKSVTRQLARDLGLPVADKPDSQEICFVGEAGGYKEFLRKARPQAFDEGDIVDESGQVLTRHGGIADFTVGQRKGIRTTVANGRALYVLRVEPAQNRVVVGHEESLLATTVRLKDMVWGVFGKHDAPKRVMAKIRYNMEPQPATLFGGDEPYLEFRQPVRAITPGQMMVAYSRMSVAAGGIIVE